MSGLETLPPDQRAVLQLILVQGRGYAELATLLRLDVDAVRSRAVAAVETLGGEGGAALDTAERARVADYLLGQQDDGQRIVTFAALGESAAACRWAQALRERLAAVARVDLPAVPSAAAPAAQPANGSAPVAVPVAPASLATGGAPAAAPVAVAEQPALAEPAPPAASPPAPPVAPAGPELSEGSPRPPSSRIGGALLLAGLLALVVVLVIVLTGGGDDDPSGSAAATTGAPQTQTQTQPAARRRQSAPPAARPLAQVNLTPTAAGGQAIGIGLVQRVGRRTAIAIEAQRLPANGAQDIYAVWLQGDAGSRFLGFVPRQVRADGRFTVSAPMPGNASSFTTVLVTREGVTEVPQTPGEAILSGTLSLSG